MGVNTKAIFFRASRTGQCKVISRGLGGRFVIGSVRLKVRCKIVVSRRGLGPTTVFCHSSTNRFVGRTNRCIYVFRAFRGKQVLRGLTRATTVFRGFNKSNFVCRRSCTGAVPRTGKGRIVGLSRGENT